MKTQWTSETAKEEAKKYKTKAEFQKGSNGAYNFCSRNELLEDACGHMENRKIIWNPELVKEVALKYKTRTDFYVGSNSAYRYSLRNDLMEIVCSHMKKEQRTNIEDDEEDENIEEDENNVDDENQFYRNKFYKNRDMQKDADKLCTFLQANIKRLEDKKITFPEFLELVTEEVVHLGVIYVPAV